MTTLAERLDDCDRKLWRLRDYLRDAERYVCELSDISGEIRAVAGELRSEPRRDAG